MIKLQKSLPNFVFKDISWTSNQTNKVDKTAHNFSPCGTIYLLHLASVLTAWYGHRFAIDVKKKEFDTAEKSNPAVSTNSSVTHFCSEQHCRVS